VQAVDIQGCEPDRDRKEHDPVKPTASLLAALTLAVTLVGGVAAQSPQASPAPSAEPDATPMAELQPVASPSAADTSDFILPEGQPEGAVQHPTVPSALMYPPPTDEQRAGLSKIRHIVIIIQENRSFDHYFGTYPGAEGIPMKADGKTPKVCVKHPTNGSCVKPYHDKNFIDAGGPHRAKHHNIGVNGGKMNGFLKAVWKERSRFGCFRVGDVRCMPGTNLPDVVGYKNRREIPNYWKYADRFVLQDHMFEPVRSYSLPAHLYLVSAWSAICENPYNPMSCRSALKQPEKDNMMTNGRTPIYGWTDITYLLRENKIRWRYYVGQGTPVDCGDGRGICNPDRVDPRSERTASTVLWNPLSYFTTVQQARQVDNIQRQSEFFKDLKAGRMANVIWIAPSHIQSEHAPDAFVDDGQAWVTQVVNAIGKSKFWDSTAIFVTWDDWGGFYDHVVPPVIDDMGYGIRVPGLTISPYAKEGFIDKQVLSFDAYLKFIEDVFLDGQRLDPKTMSRPDPRPTVREEVEEMGDLIHEFDFTQEPRNPVILPKRPRK
jgi:phospholipase C